MSIEAQTRDPVPIESTPTQQDATNYQPPRGLTVAQRELVRAVVTSSPSARLVSLEQRATIRQVASAGMSGQGPEQFLVAFKSALVDAANTAGIRPGPERNETLARVVSVFIEELYRQAVHDDIAPSPDEIRPSDI